jgi:hypothetical protein
VVRKTSVHERFVRGLSVGLTTALVTLTLVAIQARPAAAAVATELRRYPYLTDLVTTNVTINWATTTSLSTGSATYGLVGSETCTAHTVTASRTSITVGSTAEYQWKAQVTGLDPDAQYCYRVFGGSVDLLGTDPSPVFKSQLAAGSSSPFSFAVFGDWGLARSDGTNVDQTRLMSQIASSGARFAVTTGDNGYNGGSQTDYGDLVQTGPGLSGIFGPDFWPVPGRSIPLFPTQGNHGMNSVGLTNWPQDRAVATSGGTYKMETYCCPNGTSSASYPSAWYAFDAGDARFYVLEASWANSNVGTSDLYGNDAATHWSVNSAEYQWLANDLAAHPGAMKFAFFHFPMYSANGSETSDTYLQGPAPKLEGLLGDNGVDIMFNGHAHTYARSAPSAPGMPVGYVTGAGGAELQSVSKCGAPIAAAIGWSVSSNQGSSCGNLAAPTSPDEVYHFLLVRVDGSTVTVTPTDEMGRTFDQKTYDFSGGGGGGTNLSFSPTDDATIIQGSATTNFGAATTLQTDGSPVKDFLMKYDVSGIGTSTVSSATLRMFVSDSSPSGGVVRPTSSTGWDEGSVTWSNAPPGASSPTATIGRVSSGTWMTVDVTPFVQGDGVLSLRIGSSNSDGADYTSTEGTAANAPQLLVTTIGGGGGGGGGDTEDPMPPTNLSASASADRVELSWTAGTDNVGVTGYRVWRNGTAVDTIGDVISYTDTNVTAAATYTYTVQSLDAAGNSSNQSEPATATVPSGSGSGQLTFTPTDDATIVQGSANTNFGSATSLQTDGSPVKDFLTRFDVSGIGTSTVTSATLRLFVVDPSSSGGTVRPTTTVNWNEGSVTWSTAPAAASSPTAAIGKVTSGTWMTVDVTPFVQGNGALSLRVSSTSSNGADYTSRQGTGANVPQLVVTFGDGGGGGGGGTQLSFSPTDDASIIQGSASTNFGSATTLQTDGSPVKDFLMKFDVTGVGTSTVTSATLRLFVVDSSSAGGVVRPTSSTAWDEGSVTWSTAPPAASSPTATIGSVSSGTWITVDVTAFVQGDGVVSLRISSTNSNGADYTSRQGTAANAPELVVTTS